MALAAGERSHKVLVPCIHKCMADPRHIQTLFEFCIATSAVLWSSIVSRIFGAIAPAMRFARARPFSVRSCLTYRLPPTSRICTRPRLTWPKVSRCRDTTATFSSRASSAHGGRFHFELCRMLAPNGPPAMSAQWSLTGGKRTWRGRSSLVANDPTETSS
jgi:hypothetical protein